MFLEENPYIRFKPNIYTDLLANNWQTIRDELFALCVKEKTRGPNGWLANPTNTGQDKVNGVTDNFGDYLYTGRFNGFSIYIRDTLSDGKEKTAMRWRADEKERWWPWRCEQMPWIGNYAREFHSVLGSVTFNTAYPGSRLNHHWGLDPDYLRIHVCLESAAGCRFNIEGWEHEWTDGEVFGFDDAYVLHGTAHTGTKPRTIMLLDIKKSALKEHCLTWPCRGFKPERSEWPAIQKRCTEIKTV